MFEAEDMYINEIMPDKLKLNLEYIEKSNVFYDIYIIFKTVKQKSLLKLILTVTYIYSFNLSHIP